MPPRPALVDQQRVPDGWELRRVERVTKGIRKISRGAGPLFVECAWSPGTLTGRERFSRYEDLKRTAPRYEPIRTRTLSKRARLLGLAPKNAKRFLAPSVTRQVLRDGVWSFEHLKDPYRILDIYRPVGKKLWLPAEYPQQTRVEEEERIYLEGSLPVFVSNITFRLPSGLLGSRVFEHSDVIMEAPPSYEATHYKQCAPPRVLCGGRYVVDSLPDYLRANLWIPKTV